MAVKLPDVIPAAAPRFPSGCEPAAARSRPLPARNRLDIWNIDCPAAPAPGDVIEFPWERQALVVQARWLDGSEHTLFLRGAGRTTAVALNDLRAGQRTPLSSAGHYLSLGVKHILLGWDHLAFGGNWRYYFFFNLTGSLPLVTDFLDAKNN